MYCYSKNAPCSIHFYFKLANSTQFLNILSQFLRGNVTFGMFLKKTTLFSCWDFEGCLFFPFSIKITIFCVLQKRESHRFGTKWGRLNDDRIEIFSWSFPLRNHKIHPCMLIKITFCMAGRVEVFRNKHDSLWNDVLPGPDDALSESLFPRFYHGLTLVQLG